ncbi:RNA-binding protein pno1 [Parasteatoda tepidariorum]|uniref:RNA-binding protein pno1 n=1 Tax=Parasteatoda tepidariorum TaxID=114398 RepID=UPI001C71BA77|nr:RNA-binding protein pno1 [Parasteatoda tepidariorum]
MEESNKHENSDVEWSVPKSKKRKQTGMDVDMQSDRKRHRPHFPPAKSVDSTGKGEMRKIPVPPNRYTPLKENWMKIFTTVVEHLHLSIRFNLKRRMVEIQTCKETKDVSALQKAADFVHAFTLGFDVDDAMSLVRLDELFLESFDIKDVKTLHGDHISRAIGRLVGKGGRTKYTIENATKTRIVVADSKIHIMGSYQHIRAARTTLCNLILGCAPSKVHGTMRQVANRLSESL